MDKDRKDSESKQVPFVLKGSAWVRELGSPTEKIKRIKPTQAQLQRLRRQQD